MDFSYTTKVQELIGKLKLFMEEIVYPNEALYEHFSRRNDVLHKTARS